MKGERGKGRECSSRLPPEHEACWGLSGCIPGPRNHDLNENQESTDLATKFPCCLCYWSHILEVIANVIKLFLFILSSGVLLRVLAPFLANFYIACKVRIQIHSFACVYTIFPGLFAEKTDITPLNGPGTLYYFESLKCHIWFKVTLVNNVL